MSTRAFIAVKKGNGYEAIYLHRDADPEHALSMLGNYATPDKARALINLGDLSELNDTLESTVAYHRDRGEAREDTKAGTYRNLRELCRQDISYIYTFSGKDWRTLKVTF